MDLVENSHTLTEAFEALVERRGDDRSLVFLDRHGNEDDVPLRSVWQRACEVQGTLVARGIEPGSPVVLVLPTSPELLSTYFGVLLAGGTPALLSTPSNRVADPEIFVARIAHVVATAKPHAICCTTEVAEMLSANPSRLGTTILVTPDDVTSNAPICEPVQLGPESIATIQFSSGTTGAPKGILISHRAVLNNLRAMKKAFEIAPRDVYVNWIPLYHDMGLFGACLLPLLCECLTVLIAPTDFLRDPTVWLRAFQHYRGTVAWAPNLAYALCGTRLSDRDLEGLDLSSWRLALNGSEPVLARSIKAFAERMEPYGFSPASMSPAWGLAEVVALSTVQPIHEPPRCEIIDRAVLATEDVARPSDEGISVVSVGCAIPGTEFQIRDAAGAVLADRHVGAVWVETDSLFTAYLDDPERTAAARIDGWLATGDRGYAADGHLFFVSREKDLIIIGGEKYLPDDIESIINSVKGVRQGCAVAFGVINEDRGTEDLAAVVETRETTPEGREALRSEIRGAITRSIGLGVRWLLLTPPGGVEKTTSGKLSRSGTRERYQDQLRDN